MIQTTIRRGQNNDIFTKGHPSFSGRTRQTSSYADLYVRSTCQVFYGDAGKSYWPLSAYFQSQILSTPNFLITWFKYISIQFTRAFSFKSSITATPSHFWIFCRFSFGHSHKTLSPYPLSQSYLVLRMN